MTRSEQALHLAVLDLARLQLAEEGIDVRPLSLREIADVSGVPPVTSLGLERRALAKIRTRLHELGEVDLPGLPHDPDPHDDV